MPRRRRRGFHRFRLGTDLGAVERGISKAIEGKPAKEIWEQEFRTGKAAFYVWLQMNLPFVDHIKTHPDLTEEQRAIANRTAL